MFEDLVVSIILQAAEDVRQRSRLDAQNWLLTTGAAWATSLGVDPDVFNDWVRSGCRKRL